MFYKRLLNHHLAPMTQEMWSSAEILPAETELKVVLKCDLLQQSTSGLGAPAPSSLLQLSPTLGNVNHHLQGKMICLQRHIPSLRAGGTSKEAGDS